jgi:hypothetical protein
LLPTYLSIHSLNKYFRASIGYWIVDPKFMSWMIEDAGPGVKSKNSKAPAWAGGALES